MKILLVNKFHYIKGGSETYYFTLAKALEERGHQVVYFAMKDPKNLPCKQECYFVSNASVRGGISSRLKMLLHIAYSKEAYNQMRRLLIVEKPDLVLLNLVHKQITLSIIDAIKEYDPTLPIFWTMHDLIAICPSYTMLDGSGRICEKCLPGSYLPCIENRCIKGNRLMSVLSWYEAKYIHKRKWYDQVDLFICPSEFYRKKLSAARFTKSEIITMRNPLPSNTEYFCGTRGDYVLYFGRISHEKGIKTLIDAAKITECRLIILGKGPAEVELKEYAKFAPNISFEGFQSGENLRKYVRESCCVVLPSEWYENGPYSAMEAMAVGKPLIVSDKGGLPELVENGETGYVYTGGSEELAVCITKMLALDAQEYYRLSRNAMEKAKALFGADAYAREIENRYFGLKRSE